MGLQELIDETPLNGRLELPPGEFFGQVMVNRPITITGKGKATWIGSRIGPTVRITSPGVKLRDLLIESTTGPDEVAIQAEEGTNPILQDVAVRGEVIGIAAENIKGDKPGDEADAVPISFTPPPPISPSVGDSTAFSNSDLARVSPIEVSPVDRRISSLHEEAEQASRQRDWPKAIEAYQDILALSPNREDVKKLLELARRKTQTEESSNAQTGARSPATTPKEVPASQAVGQAEMNSQKKPAPGIMKAFRVGLHRWYALTRRPVITGGQAEKLMTPSGWLMLCGALLAPVIFALSAGANVAAFILFSFALLVLLVCGGVELACRNSKH